MLEKREPIQVRAAIDKIMEHLGKNETEMIPIEEADRRILAEDIIADHPVPFFDRSPLDGFAIRAEDSVGASFDSPIALKVIESIGAGYVAGQAVKKSEAIRIMTGAPIPQGANAIVMLELVEELEIDGQKWIKINRPFQPNENVSKRGEDTAEGTILAPAGRKIMAGELTMLATFGYSKVKVYKQPKVGIYATGTELLPVDAPLAPGKIRNSNTYMLQSQLKNIGAIPINYGILPDDLELCYKAIEKALAEVDFLITTGGVSVGDYDYIPHILKRMGAKTLFNKIAMRPGSVTTVATIAQKWIFGLSGNPAACYVGFELFARPVLLHAQGSSSLHLPKLVAELQHDIAKPNAFTRFMRAKAIFDQDRLRVSSIGLDKSGVASALIDANVLMVIPGGTKGIKSGERVEVLWLNKEMESTY